MTLQEIEAFLAVVRTGSLSAAAKELEISQSALSRRIDSLEGELGATIIVRGKGNRVAFPTVTGRNLVPMAQQWLRLWEQTGRVVAEGMRPVLNVAASHTLASTVMPYVLADFNALEPSWDLMLTTLHSNEAYEQVEKGVVQVAFVANTRYSVTAATTPVVSEPMVLVCRQDEPWGGEVHPSELDASKSIRIPWTHEYELWHNHWFGAGKHQVWADSFSLVRELVRARGFWVAAPLSAAKAVLAHGGLRIARFADAPPERVTCMLTNDTPDSTALTLASSVKETMERLCGQ